LLLILRATSEVSPERGGEEMLARWLDPVLSGAARQVVLVL
jgi:hypothetical protein